MENHISFFQTPWKYRLPKEIALEYDLSCIFRKDDIFFTKIWSYPLDEKWKMIKKILKKYMEIWYFIRMFRRDGLFKKIAPEYNLSCIWKDGNFFLENMIFFLWGENERRSFSRNTWKYDIFCTYMWALQTWYYAPCQKQSKTIFSRKSTPKGDWHPRLTP